MLPRSLQGKLTRGSHTLSHHALLLQCDISSLGSSPHNTLSSLGSSLHKHALLPGLLPT